MCSCDKNEGFLASSNNTSGIKEGYRVVIIENCEYITYDYAKGYGGYAYLAHKGNCSNPIHCHNQQ